VLLTVPAYPLNAMEKTETATDGAHIKDGRSDKLGLTGAVEKCWLKANS
jgi:hypothetical protein